MYKTQMEKVVEVLQVLEMRSVTQLLSIQEVQHVPWIVPGHLALLQ